MIIFSNNKKRIINVKPKKAQRTFLLKPKTLKNYGIRCSVSSFNSGISLRNSDVPSLKTTFNLRLISGKA